MIFRHLPALAHLSSCLLLLAVSAAGVQGAFGKHWAARAVPLGACEPAASLRQKGNKKKVFQNVAARTLLCDSYGTWVTWAREGEGGIRA